MPKRATGASTPPAKQKPSKPAGKPTASGAPSYLDNAPTATPPKGKLEKLKNMVRECRDLDAKIQALSDLMTHESQTLTELQRKKLPDFMNEIGVPEITIEAEGDMPAYTAKKLPFYRANISSEWDEEKKAEAFKTLAEFGGEDLIKIKVEVWLPKGSIKILKAIEKFLTPFKKQGVEFTISRSVPWSSLTSWLKECYEQRKVFPPLEKIGGDVGEIVKPKAVKQKGK